LLYADRAAQAVRAVDLSSGVELTLTERGPVAAGPLSWLVPSLVIIAGVLVMLMAAPLARAASDRNS